MKDRGLAGIANLLDFDCEFKEALDRPMLRHATRSYDYRRFTWTFVRIFRTKRIAKRKAAFSALLEGAESYDGAAFLFAPKQFWITVLGCGHR